MRTLLTAAVCIHTHCTEQMRDDATLLFALAPTWVGRGAHAPGQRFFGTYPEGQLRFKDGRPSIKVHI
jgi:hypothetical protein